MSKLPFLSRFLRLFSRQNPQSPATPPLAARILGMLAATEEEEIGCDEVFDLLDRFVDLKAAGEDPSAYLPLVGQHLKICPDCREEYEALLSMVSMEESSLALQAS